MNSQKPTKREIRKQISLLSKDFDRRHANGEDVSNHEYIRHYPEMGKLLIHYMDSNKQLGQLLKEKRQAEKNSLRQQK